MLRCFVLICGFNSLRFVSGFVFLDVIFVCVAVVFELLVSFVFLFVLIVCWFGFVVLLFVGVVDCDLLCVWGFLLVCDSGLLVTGFGVLR